MLATIGNHKIEIRRDGNIQERRVCLMSRTCRIISTIVSHCVCFQLFSCNWPCSLFVALGLKVSIPGKAASAGSFARPRRQTLRTDEEAPGTVFSLRCRYHISLPEQWCVLDPRLYRSTFWFFVLFFLYLYFIYDIYIHINILGFLCFHGITGDRFSMPRKRHEQSLQHQAGLAACNRDEDLVPCQGLPLATEDGKSTEMGHPRVLDMLDMWLRAGCIGAKGSLVETFVLSEDTSGYLVVRDQKCIQAGAQSLCQRSRSSCKQCLLAANRSKAIETIKEWCIRIGYVELSHIALSGSRKEQHEKADWLKAMFPHLCKEPLETMPYTTLVTQARGMFMSLATNRQNAGLQRFIGRSLRFLQPKMLAGIDDDQKGKVLEFVDALGNGSLEPGESKAIVPGLSFSMFQWNLSGFA